MFFWINLILFIISAIVCHIKNCKGTLIADIFFITFASVIISIIFFILIYTPAEAEYNSKLEEQKGLEYKIANSEVRDDFNIVGLDLANEIQDWNKDLAHDKIMCHNFWFGIYIPNYYDKLDYIEYNLKTKEEVEPYEHIINDPNI